MDFERFQALLDDARYGQADLVEMRKNALARNAIPHVHAAETALDRRFPEWRQVRTRRGGAQATEAEFLGSKESFDTEKAAYIWLIERFVHYYPRPFDAGDWETLFVAKGRRTFFFARSLERLFKGSPHLAEDRNCWHRLSNGWYAKLVLSEPQKRAILMRFASVAGLRFGVDWDWKSEGRAKPRLSADELLRELETL